MNPVRPSLKSEWLPIILIVISFALGFYFYGHLPARVPSHWNINGEVDAYSGRFFGAWFVPLLTLGMYLLFLALPYIDPKKEHYVNFIKAYHGVKNLIIIFLFALYIFTALAGLGYNISIGLIMPSMIGLLFVGLGYFIKSIHQNWWMGVRTPWTMESPTVWKKTNELMAKLMMVGGIFIALGILLVNDTYKISLFVAVVIIIAVVPVVYSYFAYRAEQKKK